jgi:hypothetical protein
MESRVQPTAEEDRPTQQEAAEGACGLNHHSAVARLKAANKWLSDEIVRVRGDREVVRLQRDAAAGEVEKLRSRLRLADAALQSTGTTISAEISFQLTDAEREAIAAGLGALERLYEDSPPISQPIYEQHAPTLRRLLERLK